MLYRVLPEPALHDRKLQMAALNALSPADYLAPITLVCDFANVMVVLNASPAKSVGEFIAYARANRGKVTFGSSGTGAAPHMSGELFKRLANVEMTHVPYRGGGFSAADGACDASWGSLPASRPSRSA